MEVGERQAACAVPRQTHTVALRALVALGLGIVSAAAVAQPAPWAEALPVVITENSGAALTDHQVPIVSPARTSPAADSAQVQNRVQRRSPIRSDSQPQNTIAMAPQV